MTQGLSGKLKLATLLASIATALVTALVVIFPDVLTPQAAAAVTGAIASISAAVGAYLGSPGDVTAQPAVSSDALLGVDTKAALDPTAAPSPDHASDA